MNWTFCVGRDGARSGVARSAATYPRQPLGAAVQRPAGSACFPMPPYRSPYGGAGRARSKVGRHVGYAPNSGYTAASRQVKSWAMTCLPHRKKVGARCLHKETIFPDRPCNTVSLQP